MLSCYHSTTYFWNRVSFRKKRFIMCYFSFEPTLFAWLSDLQMPAYIPYTSFTFRLFSFLDYLYYMICLTRCAMLGTWYVREKTNWACGMLRMWTCWDVGYWGCGILGMLGVGDSACWGCGMLEMWDIGNMGILRMWDAAHVGCFRCGMVGMWDIRDAECSGCGMFGMCNVWDVGCSGCGMFRMWDVQDVGCSRCRMLIYEMPRVCEGFLFWSALKNWLWQYVLFKYFTKTFL